MASFHRLHGEECNPPGASCTCKDTLCRSIGLKNVARHTHNRPTKHRSHAPAWYYQLAGAGDTSHPDSTIIASHPLLTPTPTRTTIGRGVSCREAPTRHARCVVGCACRCSQFQVITGEAEAGGVPSPQTTSAGTSDYGPRTLTAIAAFAFLSTNVPPTNIVVQSIPVSTCRFLVVIKQTDGAIFVVGCQAHGGSA